MSISSPAELMKTFGVLRRRHLFKVHHRLGRVMKIGDLPVQRDLKPLGNWVSHTSGMIPLVSTSRPTSVFTNGACGSCSDRCSTAKSSACEVC